MKPRSHIDNTLPFRKRKPNRWPWVWFWMFVAWMAAGIVIDSRLNDAYKAEHSAWKVEK